MRTPSAMRIDPVRTDAQWDHARAIRQRVFVEEQACPPEEEWDVWDAPDARGTTCHHLIGVVEEAPVAVARWRPVHYDGEPTAKLERFAVLPEARGRGLGRAIIAAAIGEAKAAGFHTFVLHAQAHLEALYVSFGFTRVGGVFDEAGIPHVKMVRRDGSS